MRGGARAACATYPLRGAAPPATRSRHTRLFTGELVLYKADAALSGVVCRTKDGTVNMFRNLSVTYAKYL